MFADGVKQARTCDGPEGRQAAMAAAGAAERSAMAAGKERITGTVTLSSAMKGKVIPDDMLFVLARRNPVRRCRWR